MIQGLTLPAVIRLLKLEDDGEEAARDEAQARIRAADAALVRLEELVDEEWVREDTAERVRGGYDFRRNRFSAWLDGARRRLDRGPLARLPAAAPRAAERRARRRP